MNPETLKNRRDASTHDALEEGHELLLDFYKLQSLESNQPGVVPVIVQNADTGEVLILAYVTAEALERSMSQGIAIFYSTSRKELWIKGATSGDYLDLAEIRINCEQNSLLYLVRPRKGGVCHTRDASGSTRPSCFYRRLSLETSAEASERPGSEAEDSQKELPISLQQASSQLPWHDS
ncbi:MAG: phosphoribosyl-AMP cyclohydrolase [Leptospiraceae bacterium]|nr:phosphoribosyl-AMP cyclohydrolase [Leptospiraceae bacterium]MCB1169530.1 phosphoribosyl-AMP cyclohydrolase [Leptospiraceae bacterium]